MKSQYIIITITIITLVISILFLFYTEQKQRKDSQDFWSIYFVDPIGSDNAFIIDNASKKNLFIYKVHSKEKELESNDIPLNNGEQKLIKVENSKNIKPITITVTDGETEKTIEKK
ncbi:MAG: hypothetical protein CR972_03370 [Candidatus Moraniibacteriota bacterium]|nr:MAG: hypothetical protein CR972_03370 [Candidatus Moranbacteria bacterium]